MRKISKTRSHNHDRSATDSDPKDTRPLRIPGATITTWPGSVDIDLNIFFARRDCDPTVAGAISEDLTQSVVPAAGRPNPSTVSLSDGTRITFATADEFDRSKSG